MCLGEMSPGKPLSSSYTGMLWLVLGLPAALRTEVSVLQGAAPLLWGDLVACRVGRCFRVASLLAAWTLFL